MVCRHVLRKSGQFEQNGEWQCISKFEHFTHRRALFSTKHNAANVRTLISKERISSDTAFPTELKALSGEEIV